MTPDLSLLQLWLGLATTLGTLLGGLLTIQQSRHFYISSRLLIQTAMAGAAVAMFSLYCVRGYYGYILSVTLYGLCLGCLLYTTKIYCYNSVKAKDFAHVWSIVMSSQSVSCLAGIMITGRDHSDIVSSVFSLSGSGGPRSRQTLILFSFLLSGYINSTYSKTGYWFSILSVLLATCILSLVNIEEEDGVLHSLPSLPSSSTASNLTKRTAVSYDPEISMNFGSKVDKYLGEPAGQGGSGDMNGNFKLRQGDRKLSYSDPTLLNSTLWEQQGLRRQTTWHRISEAQQERQENRQEDRQQDNLVIDQITSTV